MDLLRITGKSNKYILLCNTYMARERSFFESQIGYIAEFLELDMHLSGTFCQRVPLVSS